MPTIVSSSEASSGSRSPASTLPSWLVSSVPSFTPPSSVSGSSTPVLVVGSASAMQLFLAASVAPSSQLWPARFVADTADSALDIRAVFERHGFELL